MQGLYRGAIGMTGALALAIGCGGKVVEGAADAFKAACVPFTAILTAADFH